MKKILSNRGFLSIIFFILGGSTVWAINHFALKLAPTKTLKNQVTTEVHDPFDDIKQMKTQMFNQFNRLDNFQDDIAGAMKEREDDKYIYYEIDTENQTPKELKVNVQGGQLSITGKIESKNESDDSSSFYSSSFHRSFPVPENVDADKMRMEQENNKIVLKFPKKNH